MIVAVLHNNDLNQVTWELRAMGDPPSSCVPGAARLRLRRLRRSLGLQGIKVDDPEDVWRAHGSARWPLTGPTCWTSMRPRRAADPAARDIGADQERGRGDPQGDPDRWNVVKEGLKSKLAEVVPGSGETAEGKGSGPSTGDAEGETP